MLQPETNRNNVVARLKRDGWVGRIVVPCHRTLSPGVARVIAKVAGWLDP
jgi:hypothetical protein